MGLRNLGVAKFFIRKGLDCRFVTRKDLSHPTDEDLSAGTKRTPWRERSIQVHCPTTGDNCLQSSEGNFSGQMGLFSMVKEAGCFHLRSPKAGAGGTLIVAWKRSPGPGPPAVLPTVSVDMARFQ